MEDICYSKCKSAVDQVEAAGEICDGSLQNALECLGDTGLSLCQSAPFVTNHYTDCNKSEKRELEEEAESPLMLNSTLALDDVQSRNLISPVCHSKMGKITRMVDGWCMEWEFKRFGFFLGFKWGFISGALGLCIWCEGCVPVLLVFAIPPPVYVKMCVGGLISVTLVPACPEFPITIHGEVHWNFQIGADFGFIRLTAFKLELGIGAGVGWATIATKCWWICREGRRRRRRRHDRRRRRTKRCNYRSECDIYIKGYVQITRHIFRAKVEFTYWTKSKNLQIWFAIYVQEIWKLWFGGWLKVYNTCIYRYDF